MLQPLVLDHGFEATDARLDRETGRARAWQGREVDPHRCLVRLDAADLDELAAVRRALSTQPLPLWLRAIDDFEVPRLRERMAAARTLLDGTPGVAVVDALPMDGLDDESARALFWLIGQLVGRQVAQKWCGDMLYEVRDTGKAFGYGVRGSTTNVELVFHTDNAFAIAPPDYVGLMCFYPAREGGLSRFCSLYAVHEGLREQYPDALERLYQPMLFDRQAEHEPGAPKVLRAPMFRCEGDRLITRANVSLVRKGYEVAGEEPDAALVAALAALETVSSQPSLWFELAIARGHLQFLNNVDTAHYRSAFVDNEKLELRRHLVRSWHRDRGRPTYDG